MVSDNDGGVVGLGQGEDLVGLAAAGFQVGGIDQAASGSGLEGDLEHVQLGGIDDQRDVDAQLELLDDIAHQVELVRALGHGAGDIQRVGAAGDLLAGELQDAVVVLLQQHLLELARALGVAAFAEQRRRRILAHGNG